MLEKLRVRRVGIETYRENIVYLPRNCELCESQSLKSLSKLEISHGKKSLLATLNVTENGMLHPGEVGLSNIAFQRLGLSEGESVSVSYPKPLSSTEFIRQKLDGKKLSRDQIRCIVHDISHARYSNIELTAFVVACSKKKLSEQEILFLTEAMVETGERIEWPFPKVFDKHCIGGIPGNRTTMIVVPIVAAFGLPIPKTSSRAITSPAGTADTMESLTQVDLTLKEMKKIVSEEKGCIAWGGSLSLAPVDDIIISVERPLNLDSEGQMIASILSKKKAAGSTHVLIDIPVGPLAKVRSQREGIRLKGLFERVGKKMGLVIQVLLTDGRGPIGRGIGPSLEAEDVVQVLERHPKAPQDLREKSLKLSAAIIEMSGQVAKGKGLGYARQILDSGQAAQKFWAIANQQGALKPVKKAKYFRRILSPTSGTLKMIHNLKIAKVAKLAGAPTQPTAGVLLKATLGQKMKKGMTTFEIFSESEENLQFACKYVSEQNDIFFVQ